MNLPTHRRVIYSALLAQGVAIVFLFVTIFSVEHLAPVALVVFSVTVVASIVAMLISIYAD